MWPRRQPTRRPAIWLVTLAAALATAHAGCGDPPGVVTSTARDSAGIRVVDNAAPVWDPGEEWVLPASPEVEIGVADGPEEYQLHGVMKALRLPDGRILVLNDGTRELRFYDPAGRWLRSVGGNGDGPGEFRSLAGASVIDDSLWVFDNALRRISVLDLDGEFVRSFTPDPTGDPVRPLRFYRLTGPLGDTAFVLLATAWPANTRPRPTVYWDAVETLLYSRDGALLDSLGPPVGMEIETGGKSEGERWAGMRPFGRMSAVALTDSVLWHSDAERFEIRGYDGAGRLRRIVRAAIEREPVDGAEWREIYERQLTGVPEDRAARARRRFEARTLPELEPAHGREMVAADDGHLWVREYAYFLSGDVPGWQVIDPDGHWLGRVAPPSRDGMWQFVLQQVGPWGALAVWRERDAVARVGVWALESAANAAEP